MVAATVLIVSDHADAHVPMVARHLESKGVPVAQLNTADIPLRINLLLTYEGRRQKSTLELPGGESIDCRDIASVWYRRPGIYQLPLRLPVEQREFALSETREAVTGFYDALNCTWVNSPAANREARNKPRQLRLALEAGMVIPRTLITNNPSDVVEFYEKCNGRVVYKTISQSFIAHRHPDSDAIAFTSAIYTSPLTPEHFEQLDSVRTAPCLFQENVPKELELRITVVRSRIFAAQIDSQANPATLHDVRRGDPSLAPWRPTELPSAVARSCLALTEQLGLIYAAIDMILTPSGHYVFLEINPNGQFGWIEYLTGLPISEAIAGALA